MQISVSSVTEWRCDSLGCPERVRVQGVGTPEGWGMEREEHGLKMERWYCPAHWAMVEAERYLPVDGY